MPQIEEDANRWIVTRNEKEGYEIKYPENINDIPSVTIAASDKNLSSQCHSFYDNDTAIATGIGEKITINNIAYCNYEFVTGIEGDVHRSIYTTIKNNKLYTIGFITNINICERYQSLAGQKDCEKSNNDRLNIASQILSTFKFIR